MKIRVTVNGAGYERDVEPRTLLAYFLREDCRLTGTHVGCDTSSCGCCVVVMDGTRAVKSCAMFAVQADGHEILTVEGLAEGGKLHALQQGFWDQHGVQCGYCTPGMLLTSYVLLKHNPAPSEADIREGLAEGGKLHALQQGFWDQHGLQCGYCTPGMLLTAYALLKQNAAPTEADIREGLAGNLCRCTGYNNIVKAVQQAAGTLAK